MGKIAKQTLTFGGKTQSVSQWANELGLPRTTITTRLYKGLPIEKVLAVGGIKRPRSDVYELEVLEKSGKVKILCEITDELKELLIGEFKLKYSKWDNILLSTPESAQLLKEQTDYKIRFK